MHVYFGNKIGWYEDEIIASLDLDDTSAFGPETVTLTLDTSLIENGVFKYSVYKFSSSGTFALSDAVVRVYKGNTLLETYNAPENTTNNVWHVFDIEKSGIVTYNDFYTTLSSSQIR